MNTFDLSRGGMLVLRVGDGPWDDVELAPGSFADPAAATPDEVAAVLDGMAGVVATVTGGELVLASPRPGADSAVEIDAARSTAAGALGLRGTVRATGRGPGPARLVGAVTEPFTVPVDAELTVRVDGASRGNRVHVPAGTHLAVAVATMVNDITRKPVAATTADGRVVLTSPKDGAGSRLQVVPGPPGADAAGVLGFVGNRAENDPWRAEPARLRLVPPAPGVTVVNLSGSPVELHLAGGSVVVPARGQLAATPDVTADPVVARLVARSVLHVEPPA